MKYKVFPLNKTTVSEYRQLFDTYDLSSVKDGKVKQWLIWLLKKLGAKPGSERVTTEVTAEVDTRDLQGFIENFVVEFYNEYQKWPSVVLVGLDIQKEIFRQEISRPIVMDYEARLGVKRSIHIQGLKVVLVPWMNGILPMLSWDDLNQ
jgi:hypothetical protein